MITTCHVCHHECHLDDGQVGFCRARSNQHGKIICNNYGKITALALDPIEKKPLRHFYPGSKILSVGSFGCNLHCKFCQNCEISMTDGSGLNLIDLAPENLIAIAKEYIPQGNIGLAYTYNEPLIGYEFIRDCAKLAHVGGLKNVVVTNGCIQRQVLKEIAPYIDAMNIDLKAFTSHFYKQMAGDLEMVKAFITLAAKSCAIEVTTLIIPGENDTEKEMDALARWLAHINPEIPLHITRFFPHYQMMGKKPTPIETIFHLSNIARRYLKYVYEGNC